MRCGARSVRGGRTHVRAVGGHPLPHCNLGRPDVLPKRGIEPAAQQAILPARDAVAARRGSAQGLGARGRWRREPAPHLEIQAHRPPRAPLTAVAQLEVANLVSQLQLGQGAHPVVPEHQEVGKVVKLHRGEVSRSGPDTHHRGDDQEGTPAPRLPPPGTC